MLDTNVISETIRPEPLPAVVAWLSQRTERDLYISSMTVAELHRGILAAPRGAKRRRLEDWFAGPDGPVAFFKGRILAFDAQAALHWATFMAAGAAAGRPRSALDMIVAAIAAANDCILVTGNERHFKGIVRLVNPFGASSRPG
jgi:predicted nucleic acid-binding protein